MYVSLLISTFTKYENLFVQLNLLIMWSEGIWTFYPFHVVCRVLHTFRECAFMIQVASQNFMEYGFTTALPNCTHFQFSSFTCPYLMTVFWIFFFFYFFVLFYNTVSSQTMYVWVIRWKVNSELRRMWKEAVVAYFETPSWHLVGWIEENSRNCRIFCSDPRLEL